MNHLPTGIGVPAMILNLLRRVDDLTQQEATSVVCAYEKSLMHEDHDDAFAAAMGVFRTFRPGLPLAVIASELELLLACAPKASAPSVFYE